MLDAEPVVSGTAKAGLYFVADEKPAVASDDLGGALEVARRRHDVATHPLDGLGKKGRRLTARGRLNNLFDVARKRLPEVALERTAIGVGRQGMPDVRNTARNMTPRRVSRQVGRQHTAAGVAVAEGDDFAAARVLLGQHDRRFHRLGPAVGKETRHKLPRRDVGQLSGDGNLVLGDIERRGMPQPPDLLTHALDDGRVAVPDGRRENAGEEVEIFLALRVDDGHAVGLDEGDRLAVERLVAGTEDGLVRRF